MDATDITTCNSADRTTCDYCTVSNWAKGNHRVIIPQRWSDLTSGEVCNCCLGKNIKETDLNVLLSMAGLLSDCLEEVDLRKLTFYEACDMFIDIVDDLDGELEGEEAKGDSTTAPPAH